MPGSSPKRQRRPMGIAIRPDAVRQARLEKGMTLAELAAGQVTRAAIHLVETGKMRPSMRTLQLIARQTGRPISYFMVGQEGSDEQRGARDELMALVESEEYRDAIDLGNELLAAGLEPGIEADVRFCVGKALVRTMAWEPALDHLGQARQLFERIGDGWMAVHALEQEAVAMFYLEDARTLGRALDALERCERLEPPAPTVHASVLNLLGNLHMRAHDWRSAVRFFEMGLHVCSGSVVSLRQAAKLHNGLSAASQRLGDFATALRSAERLFALCRADTDVTALIRAQNNLGYVLLRQGELDAAASHLYRSLELCDQHDVQRFGRAHVLNSIGELELTRGNAELARTHLLRSLETSCSFGERNTEATARYLLCRVHLQLDDEGAADRWFTEAIDLLTGLDQPERLRDCAVEYAELLYGRGRLEESIRYWRIAVSASGRGAVASTETVVQRRESSGA